MCMTIEGVKDSTKPGAPILLKKCMNENADIQEWIVEKSRIFWAHNKELCIGLEGGYVNEGVDVILENCSNAADQEWIVQKNKIHLKAPYSNYCLTPDKTGSEEIALEV